MSLESSVYTVTTDGPGAKRATGAIALLNSSGVSLFAANGMFPNGTTAIYVGACTTRDTLRAEVGTGGAIGSLYLSSAGKLYVKTAAGDATTDWQKVTSTAAD